MSITFAVADVEAPKGMMHALDRASAIPSLLGAGGRRIEAFSRGTGKLVSATDAHALAQAAHDAFYLHHPLVLSPDAVWFCLAQGFAHHVALNAEALRDRFVRHQGKAKLVVERRDFVLGQDNPWPEAFAAFSEQIAEHVGRLRDLVVADFSTTGPVERAASEVVLMDAFQPYFEYEMRIGCGIPEITLLGTVDDWRSVRRRAAMLSEFGLRFWTDTLLPLLDKIVSTAEGDVDVAFWRSFFRYDSGSGPAELNGWILALFPYIKTHVPPTDRLVRNSHMAHWQKRMQRAETSDAREPEGPALLAIPSSAASAPVRVFDLSGGGEHALRFVAGMFGVTQDRATGALAPEFGWAVVYDEA